MTFRVYHYFDCPDNVREPLTRLLQRSLDTVPHGMRALARARDGEVEVVLCVEADDKPAATLKARYWVERAVKRTKGVNWTGRMAKPPKVVKC